MSRYKGRTSLKVIQDVPQGGFGSRLNAMHDWQDERGIEAVRGQSRRENGRYHSVVLC